MTATVACQITRRLPTGTVTLRFRTNQAERYELLFPEVERERPFLWPSAGPVGPSPLLGGYHIVWQTVTAAQAEQADNYAKVQRDFCDQIADAVVAAFDIPRHLLQ